MKTKKLNGISKNGAGAQVTPQRLLAPVDFSDPSLNALDHAAHLAVEWGASLTIVHVVASDDSCFGIGREEYRDLDKSLQDQAAAELQRVATNLPPRIDLRLQVRIGRPAEEIAAAATVTNADLIILSTHGRTGLDRYFVGSVAEHLLRLAPCPVYLMPLRTLSSKSERSQPATVRSTGKD